MKKKKWKHFHFELVEKAKLVKERLYFDSGGKIYTLQSQLLATLEKTTLKTL